MSVVTETTVRSEENFRVTRSRRNVAWTGIGALIVVVVLALFPYIVYSGTTTIMEQAFVGLGAYFVLIPALHGVSPFAALPLSAAACGVAAFPLWWLVSRLRTG